MATKVTDSQEEPEEKKRRRSCLLLFFLLPLMCGVVFCAAQAGVRWGNNDDIGVQVMPIETPDYQAWATLQVFPVEPAIMTAAIVDALVLTPETATLALEGEDNNSSESDTSGDREISLTPAFPPSESATSSEATLTPSEATQSSSATDTLVSHTATEETATHTHTATLIPSVTFTQTQTPTPTFTPTFTFTFIPPTFTPTFTFTPVPPTFTPTFTFTPVPPANTPTFTFTPVLPTNTPTFTFTPTDTPTGTLTDTPTPTFTFTPTDTPTGTLTDTPTPTDTPTGTLTDTPTPTDTPTGTLTDTPTPTDTFTPTPTDTFTPTPTFTFTPTPTFTFTPTPTDTFTPTPTSTPSDTDISITITKGINGALLLNGKPDQQVDTIDFTVTNNGVIDATNVQISVTLVPDTPGAPPIVTFSQTTWTTTLSAGASQNFTLTVTAADTGDANIQLEVTADQSDPDMSNNSISEAVKVN